MEDKPKTGSKSFWLKNWKLASLFPFSQSARKGLGKEWDFEASGDAITEDIDFSKFGLPVFADNEWKLSYPDGDLRADAKILLKQKGKPILILSDYGRGKVVWSGMNLPYHSNQYKEDEEFELFLNILKQLVAVEKKPIGVSGAKWFSPEKIQIQSEVGSRGVLLKEEGYEGWQAKLLSGNSQKLKIYKTGPTYPGFMYVALPNQAPFTIEFAYAGPFEPYMTYTTALIFSAFLLDKILSGGFIFGIFFAPFSRFTKKKVNVWWEKEDEE